jgi:hypothetical protein
MSSALGAFSDGPQWDVMKDTDVLQRARDLPVGYGEMVSNQFVESFVTSLGAGTALREAAIPDRVPSRDVVVPEELNTRDPLAMPTLGGEGPVRFQPPAGTFLENEDDARQRRAAAGVLTKEEWQASPSFRTGISYDTGMSEDRASALAAWYDASQARQAIIAKGPGGFLGNAAWIGGMLAGSALDPVNYIPILGPEVRAAQIARFGRLGGSAVTSAGDAALNTAIMGGVTAGQRQSFGDDVSWQSYLTDVAIGAVIGGAFGAATSRWEGWRESRAANEIKAVVEARAALNDALGDVTHGRPVEITPTVAEAVESAAARLEPAETTALFRKDGQTQRRPLTLTQFIARGGGLPLDDEAIARDFGKVRVAGAGALARANGRSIDGYWREALIEAGYFPPDPDGYMSRDITKELFDALEAERLGQKRYSANDADKLQPVQQKVGELEKAIEKQADEIAAAHRELGTKREELNTEALYDAANRLFKGEETDPVWAYERALTAAEQRAPDAAPSKMSDDDWASLLDDSWEVVPPRRMDAVSVRPDPIDPSVTAAASSVGKRPASAAAEFGMDKVSAPAKPAADATPAAPVKQELKVVRGEDGRITGAEISKPAQELADQFGIDSKSGDFPEMAEFEQLVALGRVTPDEMAAVAKATEIQAHTEDYIRGLEAALICRVGG